MKKEVVRCKEFIPHPHDYPDEWYLDKCIRCRLTTKQHLNMEKRLTNNK